MAEELVSRIDLTVIGGAAADKAAVSLDRLAAANDEVVVSLDRSSKIRERNEAAVERLARRYDQEYRVLKQAEQAQKELDRARNSGLAGTQAYDRLQAALTKGVNDNAKAVGLARHEWVNLGRQFQDIGTMAAMGASPMQILTSQGAQIADVFSSSQGGAGAALKEFGGVVLRVATSPLTAVAAAIGTAAFATVQWQKGTDALTVSLNRMGASAGLMTGGVESIASRAAKESGISISSARELAAQFIGAGAPGRAIGGAIGITRDFGNKLGLTGEDAAAAIAGALADPTRGAEDLAKKFGLLSLAQREEIARIQDLGDKSGAAQKLISGVAMRLRELEDPTWSVGRALESLKNTASDLLSRIGRGVVGGEAENEFQRQARVASMQRSALDQGVLRQRGLDKIGEDAALAAREITAQTYAQRDAIIAERERLETLRDTASITRTMLTAEAERVKLLAQAQRALDDYVRAGQQERSLLGKTPFQRGLQEIENRFSDLARQLPQHAAPAAPAATIRESQATRSMREVLAEAERRGMEPTENNFRKLHEEGVGGQGNFRGRLIAGQSALQAPASMPASSGNDNLGSGAIAERNAQRAAFITEAQIAPIREANKELDAQRRALEAQQAAFGMSTAEVAKASKEQELLNQFQRDGIPLNDNLRSSIAATAEGYGRLAAETEAFANKQRQLVENLDFIRGSARDAIGGIASDLLHGASAADALNSALERIADRLVSLAADRAIEGIFGKTGSASGGVLGGLLGGLFGGGGGGGGVGTVAPFADGGIVGAPGGKRVNVPMAAFVGAPHFAAGGAVPVIAHAGEVILNAAQQRNVAAALAAGRVSANDNRGMAPAAAPVTVNLIGAPAGTKVQETRDSSGGRRIDVVMDERIAAAMGSPQGSEAARANYGMQRRVARR
jgi:hypothetical protein